MDTLMGRTMGSALILKETTYLLGKAPSKMVTAKDLLAQKSKFMLCLLTNDLFIHFLE
jgi:hypothetical protein